MIQLHFTADAASLTTIKYFFEETHGAAVREPIPNPSTALLPAKQFGGWEVREQLYIIGTKKVFIIFPFRAQRC